MRKGGSDFTNTTGSICDGTGLVPLTEGVGTHALSYLPTGILCRHLVAVGHGLSSNFAALGGRS